MARRVLCVTSSFPRWKADDATPFVSNLAKDLQRLGWDVDVLAPHAPGAATRETLDGVQVERFRYLVPEAQQTVCYQGGALINLRRSPSNWLRIPPLVLAELLAVATRLRSRRYDLVHSHWILPQGFVASLVAPALGIPHVATAHGGDVFVLRGRLPEAFKRFALARANAVTVNSSVTGAEVDRLLAGEGAAHLIPMGVSVTEAPADAARRTELRALHRRGDGPLLIFVGRMVREKGVAELIESLGILRESFPEVRALLVGEGPDRPAFQALAEGLGLGDRLSFTGWVEASQVPGLLGAADIYVGPSHTEAQGLAFLEAMWAGIPVVAARVGGIPDVVRHQETGLLVEPGSPRQVAEAVTRIRSDAGLASGLARRARDLVRTSYSRDAAAARFSALFESLLDARRRP